MNIERRIRVVFSYFVCLASLLTQSVVLRAQENGPEKLNYTGSVLGDGLQMVTSVEVSSDGKFLYASAWQSATISVFQREPMSGELIKVQELTNHKTLAGATAVRLSPDSRFAVACAFRSQTAVLYLRDPRDGKLTQLDVVRNNAAGVTGLQWAVDAAFSPDSKFVYVVDSRGRGQGGGVATGCITVFRITEEGKLAFIEASGGRGGCFANARGIAMHPDGKRIAVVSSDAATLVVLNRHFRTGKTTVRQVINDEQNEVHGLDGAMGVALSPDGQFVYVSAGRFRGDDAISVYQFNEIGHLSLVQELMNDAGVLKDFVGGNEITVSPDGHNVYAVASRSGSLACFRRDTKTGKLSFLETIPDEKGRLKAAAGVCLSPDGNFVYVAAEPSQMISIFRRTTKK